MNKESLISRFNEIYGKSSGIRVFHSPGRVNLIGEYTDVNGGFVFPCALNLGIYAVCSKRDDNIVCVSATDFKERVCIDVSEKIVYSNNDGWANYPKGVIKEIINMGKQISGLNVLFGGNIPTGAGLSSSAAIEVLTAVMFNEVFSLNIDSIEVAKLSQRAENNFVGMMCGIMDQFSAAKGKKDYAFKLNCQTLEHTYCPLTLDKYSLIIANTNKRRGLVDSKYNERRNECEKALKFLQKEVNADCLCAVSKEHFFKYSHLITDNVCLKRARHIIFENNRTLDAYNALTNSDFTLFGKLLNESHESLKDDFEVTGFHLDSLAESAQQIDGCLGSRMTGAGFGGCTISIVKSDEVERFIAKLGKAYTDLTNITADFYEVSAGDGAREV